MFQNMMNYSCLKALEALLTLMIGYSTDSVMPRLNLANKTLVE